MEGAARCLMPPSQYRGCSQLALASFCGHKGPTLSLSLSWNSSIPDRDPQNLESPKETETGTNSFFKEALANHGPTVIIPISPGSLDITPAHKTAVFLSFLCKQIKSLSCLSAMLKSAL